MIPTIDKNYFSLSNTKRSSFANTHCVPCFFFIIFYREKLKKGDVFKVFGDVI